MEKKVKLAALSLGGILFLMVSIFIFLIINFDPPKREFPNELMFHGNKSSNNSISDNLDRNTRAPQNSLRESPNDSAKDLVSFRILLKDKKDGKPISNLICRIYLGRTLYDRVSNNNGECLFNNVKISQRDRVDIYSRGMDTFYDKVLLDELKTDNQTISVEIDMGNVNCTDSDNGFSVYAYGVVTWHDSSTGRDVTIADSCTDGNKLNEMICENNGMARNISFTCPEGCKEGVCLKGVSILEEDNAF